MSKNVKYSIAGVVLVAIVAVAATAAAKKGNKPTDVRVEAVQKRDLVASVTASGQVRPHTKVDLSSDISGKIVKLSVKEGDVVKQGQFLLQIDQQQYEAAVLRADAQLANAKSSLTQSQVNLTQAQSTYRRLIEIRNSNPHLASTAEIETAKTSVDVNTALADAARHNVEQADAGLKDARVALGKTTIFAPMSGRVTRLNVQNGETAIQGTLNKDAATLLTISDMSVLETKVKVDETDIPRVKLGDSTVVQLDAFPDTTFQGRVVEISNSSVKASTGAATDQAIDYEVTVRLLNPPRDTKPDFSATAKIITDTRQNVLSIPIIALTVRENETLANSDTVQRPGKAQNTTKQVGKKDVEGVFVIGTDNKVTFRPVKVGIPGEKHFEVRSGLKEGEKIVAGTYQAIRELKDGALVREMKQADTKQGAKKAGSGK